MAGRHRPRMLMRVLGRTGIRVSVLGLGTVKFGRNTGLPDTPPFELPSPDAIAELLLRAEDLGINLLDTAPAYGSSEERLGEALTGRREAWVIATKVGEEFDGGTSRFDFSAGHTQRSVERSLVRLRTGRLDLVSIHSDGRPVADIASTGAVAALVKLRDQGVIRAIGFSGKGVEDGETALEFADVLMCTINASAQAEIPLARAAGRQGIGVLVKKPLARGREAAGTLPSIVSLPGVSAVIVGTVDPAHLAANAAALA